jgi:hypothetical protein
VRTLGEPLVLQIAMRPTEIIQMESEPPARPAQVATSPKVFEWPTTQAVSRLSRQHRPDPSHRLQARGGKSGYQATGAEKSIYEALHREDHQRPSP